MICKTWSGIFSNGTRTLREEITESRGSVTAVQTAMEMGEVEGMSDAMVVTGKTCKLKQGMTEIITETQKSKEGNELHENKEEHTQVELVGDIRVELGECVRTQCEGQINLPQE